MVSDQSMPDGLKNAGLLDKPLAIRVSLAPKWGKLTDLEHLSNKNFMRILRGILRDTYLLYTIRECMGVWCLLCENSLLRETKGPLLKLEVLF
jgi:hypothetical protein